MNKLFVRVALIGCAAIAVSPALANHSWGNYHWARTSNPATLRVNKALTGSWGGYADIAIGEWNASSKLDLTTYPSANVLVNRKKCNPIANQMLVCNDSYGQRGWLGIASIWAQGNHITQATTKLNDTYFNMAQYSSAGWHRLVTCQEIGHGFGLAHQDETFNNQNLGSCMDYTNNPDASGAQGEPNNWSPDSHDMAQLDTIYSHLDSTTTDTRSSASTNFGVREPGKPAPQSAPSEGAGDGPAQWGRAIHKDAKGRPDIFIRYLGGDYRMITHVLWAMEAKGTEAG
jgi:hypothetical protein